MGIPPDGAGRGGGGLGRTEGRAAGGEQSTEKGIGRARAECAGVMVIDRSIDWNASFANCTERVQKGIAHWDKQNHAVPAPNCMLKVQGEIIKDESL